MIQMANDGSQQCGMQLINAILERKPSDNDKKPVKEGLKQHSEDLFSFYMLDPKASIFPDGIQEFMVPTFS